jgi:hypothetical protein
MASLWDAIIFGGEGSLYVSPLFAALIHIVPRKPPKDLELPRAKAILANLPKIQAWGE